MDEAVAQLVVDKAAVRANCDVWRTICQKAKDDQAKTEAKLTAARSVLKTRGVVLDDSMAKRIVTYLPFITKEQVQLYHPMLLPVALALLGSVCIAIGVHGREAGEAGSRDAPAEAETEPESPQQKRLVIPSAPRPKLATSNPTAPVGSVKRILTDNLEAASGERVELADLASRYRSACHTQGRRSVSLDQFTAEVGGLCTSIGIKKRKTDDKLYLLDVRLVASAAATYAC